MAELVAAAAVVGGRRRSALRARKAVNSHRGSARASCWARGTWGRGRRTGGMEAMF